ncbi:hypothetical protein N7481_000745, partial [Penicillium waksmanii]|uniref:uncharacterized protein n=1 Tax=Penicillium waksmanii TaxID=69791 RepID=UPI00254881C0
MASSDNRRKDSASSRHRSHRGCWTCKKKRIQCDEARPGCQKCITRGLTCEGYEIRLRWGAGIASRGRYNGAEKPVKEFIPPPSKRRWDLRGKGEKEEEGDRRGQPHLLLEASFSPEQLEPITQPVSPRATVNILNEPYGQDLKDYMDITKHFELPASTRERIERDNAAAFAGDQRLVANQYPDTAS